MTDSAAFHHWFERRQGDWISERRYIYNGANKPINLTTAFNVVKDGNEVIVAWTGRTTGEMILTINGDTLERSRDYFGDGSHDSTISLIDDDTLLLHTHYDGTIYREEIRFLKGDKYALRQTIGFNDVTGETKLVGQYYEYRATFEPQTTEGG